MRNTLQITPPPAALPCLLASPCHHVLATPQRCSILLRYYLTPGMDTLSSSHHHCHRHLQPPRQQQCWRCWRCRRVLLASRSGWRRTHCNPGGSRLMRTATSNISRRTEDREENSQRQIGQVGQRHVRQHVCPARSISSDRAATCLSEKLSVTRSLA